MHLNRLINCVGKACFVKYYYFFKDDVTYKIPDFLKIIEENYTGKSKRSRAGHARMIFHNDLHIQALKSIIDSRIDYESKKIAQRLLDEETATN